MRASELDYTGTGFKPEEWPEGALFQMNSNVITALFDIRKHGYSIFPSPIYTAHVRNDDTGSRHSIKHGTRLSDATDFFTLRSDAVVVYNACKAHPLIGGLGVYQNSLYRGSSDLYTMFHIDCRDVERQLRWVGTRDVPRGAFQYHYDVNDFDKFQYLLQSKGVFW